MVSPDWVVDCIKAQELLDCEKYDVELLIKPTPPKPPIMPKSIAAPIQLIEQSQPKQLTPNLPQQLGGIGTSVPTISSSLDGASSSLASRIISTNAGLIGFAPGNVPIVSQPQVTAAFHHQQIHHPPEPKPTKSSGKSKANKHPSEQGLNEEQKHAIVMQNVKNILSQQANWNKDNSQNRCDTGQMPGTFLPTGSTPIPTGGAQRKPKSPKSPGNRAANQAGGIGGGGSVSKAGAGSQKSPKGSMKKTELAEIAVAPAASLSQQPQQQQFTTVTVDAASGAAPLFPHSTAATVLVATANPGVPQMNTGSRVPSVAQQTGGAPQTPAFLLQQQQQQYQQQALLAAQSQFQKNRTASVCTPQQVQVSPVLLQGTQPTGGQARTATFIVRAPSAPDIQMAQSATTAESVQALLEGSSGKEGTITQGVTTTAAQQVLLQQGQPSQQQNLIQLQQQQQQHNRVPSPTGGGLLSSVFIQGRQPQSQQYKQPSGQIQMQVSGLQQPQQTIRPQRAAQGMKQTLPQGQQGQQQQYAQLAQQVKANHQPQQHSHQLGHQQIIIQTSSGVQQVVTAQDLGNAQYIGTGGAQMRAVANSGAVQCASPRPPLGSPTYTQAQVMTGNGSAPSIVYHSTATPAGGISADAMSACVTQQERVTYVASVQQQQQQQTQTVGGRLQQAVVQGQQVPQQQQQTLISVTGPRPRPGGTGGQPSIIQTQQAMAIQQGQFYGQPQAQTQQQQRIIVQSPHAPGSIQQITPPQQHCMVSQSQLQSQFQQQLPQGGNFLQQQQRQMIPQSQSHQLPSGHQPQSSRATVAQLVAGARGPAATASQICQMMAAAAVKQRHMVPPAPQYRGVVAPTRAPDSTAGGYVQTTVRAQQPAIAGTQVATQPAPPPPPVFQPPAFRGHVGYPCPTSAQDCLIGCVMLLLGYHSFGEAQKTLWKKIIRSYGAEVVPTYDPARVTHVIVDWQLEEPDLIKQALRDRKRLVTIYWVNDVLAKGRLVPPYEILHLPSPFSPEITFSFIRSQVISITGFEGIERQKVELLIKQLGASFTDYLDQMNTLLICKRPHGKKYEMASLWGIPCVNVRWLQDLYLGDLSAISADLAHKYLCFDAMDVTIALEMRTPRAQELMVGWQQGICVTSESWEHLKKLRSELRQEDREEEEEAAARKNLQKEDSEDNDADKENSLTAEEVELAKTGMLRETLLRQECERAAAHRTAVAAAAALQAPAPQHSTAAAYPAVFAPPAAPQYSNPTPALNHQLQTSTLALPPSVSSTTPVPPAPTPPPHTATAQEESSAPTVQSGSDFHHFKRQHSPPNPDGRTSPPRKRLAQGRPPNSVPPPLPDFTVEEARRPLSAGPLSTENAKDPETKPSLVHVSLSSSQPEEASPNPTKHNVPPLPPSQTPQPTPPFDPPPAPPPKPDIAVDLEVRLVFTGMDTEARLGLLQLLAQMPKTGIAPYRLVENVSEATHVITDRLVRTPKIYMAVAFGCAIVTPKWVRACLVRGDWLAESDWLLRDSEAEENLGICLAESLRISHERRLLGEPGLFSDLEFWFAPKAYHREVCEQLVRACGGRVRERRPTQKMALLPIPRQIIICHEEEAHVASYLMRTKTGNRGEFDSLVLYNSSVFVLVVCAAQGLTRQFLVATCLG
uniref:PAX-interacting protein 1 n=1 Tax=Mesocestoides corti TaxID=53468 RepID=A0A5K3EFJ0_MESCO